MGFIFVNTEYNVVHADTHDELTEEDISIHAIRYHETYNEWLEKNIPIGNRMITVTPDEIDGGVCYDVSKSFGYKSSSIYIIPGDTIKFNVNVPITSLYQIYLDYYVLPESRLTPNIDIRINGNTQYNEMFKIDLDVDWKPDEELKYDRYGDQIVTSSYLVEKWRTDYGLLDPNRFYFEPLFFKLERGDNEISITMNEGHMLLGDVVLKVETEHVPTYAEYRAKFSQSKQSLKQMIKLQGETMDLKSSRSITAKYMRNPSVTPYKYKNRIFNVLDGSSFSNPGDNVTYSFAVPETGFYNIAIKYYLNLNNGIPSNRRILIDGKVPFKELNNYTFKYQTKWKNEVLSDASGKPFEFYLEKGTHTITIEVDVTKVKKVYHDLLDILERIDYLAIQINNLTGGVDDSSHRNWHITTYIPNLVSDLEAISEDIAEASRDIRASLGEDRLTILTELRIAKKYIDDFIEDPEDIPEEMSKFNEGVGSAYGRINAILSPLIYSPLNIDCLYIYNDVKLPKPNVNIFVRIIESIKAFFYSFFDPKYNEKQVVDDDTIEIWVNKSRLYVEVMQQKIDEEFTPKTGIKVLLSIMPDENKLILANAAGTTPDGAIGVSHGRPFELAIRGVIADLRQFTCFYDLAAEFNPNTFVPYIYDEGVYAIPETQSVRLLYYRIDILEQLGLTPPDTLQEVVSMLPVLQKFDMNFFHPLGSDISYKGFDVTTPFIYQFGGDLYNSETMTTIINRGGAFEAFEFMTDLYTVYNLPVNTSNFFQHFRNGKLPVGVADQNMYIQLKYAAPELAGQWGVLPIPGVMNDKGEVERWDPTYGSSSIIFNDSKKKEKTWELIKWWSSADVQADFSYMIQSVLGDRFLYMTANIEGFKESAWPSDSKDDILEQWKWIRATGRVPGDYLLERELSNAYNRVIFENVNARIAVDEAIPIINRELRRKLEEFGYMDKDGNIIKPYKVVTIDNIENWVRKNE